MYHQQTTYNKDYNKSPRVQYGDHSPRAGYYPDNRPPHGDPRYYKESPREYIDPRYGESQARLPIQPGEQLYVENPNRSPHHSPISPRRQAPMSDRSDRRDYDYDRSSPTHFAGPRRYPHYDMSHERLPPMNTYAINSTTQHDYGDFAQKQMMINDIRTRPSDSELARRYDQKYDSRPYFDPKDPPSFYRDLPLTDRSGYDVDRRAPRVGDAPLTDRSERGRRDPSGPSPHPDDALNDMARGQMKKEMDRIELHDGNFKPYSHHNLGGGGPGVLSRPIEHHHHRYEDNLVQTTSPRRGQDPGVLSRQVEHPENRYENNLVETNNSRNSKDPGVLSRQIEDHEHRFESNLVETNNPRRSTDPGILPRQVEHHEHRFENNLVETNNPRRSKDPGVLSRQIENHEHRFESNLVETNHPRRNEMMHQRQVKQKLPMHDVHRFEQVHKDHQTPAGVFLLLRAGHTSRPNRNDDEFTDVRRAFEQFTGDTPPRKLLGVAPKEMIYVLAGGSSWQKQSVLASHNGQYYDLRRAGDVDKLLAVQWFPSADKAEAWLNMDRNFRNPSFPWPSGNQTSILPLKYQPSPAKGYRTFMLMEFCNVQDWRELRRHIDFLCQELKNYRAEAGFVDDKSIGLKSPIFRGSHVVCHTFVNKTEVEKFCKEVLQNRPFQHADVTTIVFDLVDIMKK